MSNDQAKPNTGTSTSTPQSAPPGTEAVAAAWANQPSAGSAAEKPATNAEPEPVAPTLEQQLELVTAERDQFLQNWLRAQADFDNIRKRLQREAEQERQYALLPFARDLLPALDNLRRAVATSKKVAEAGNPELDQLVQGVQLVIKQFDDIFARHHILPIPSVGEPFDPNLHQAIQQVPSDKPSMSIIEEFERGYSLRDRIVRPSSVVVAAAKKE